MHDSAKVALGIVEEKVKSREWWWNDLIAEKVNKKKEAQLN